MKVRKKLLYSRISEKLDSDIEPYQHDVLSSDWKENKCFLCGRTITTNEGLIRVFIRKKNSYFKGKKSIAVCLHPELIFKTTERRQTT